MSDDEKHELVVGKFDPHSDEVAITQDYSVVAHVYGGDAGKTKALALDFVRGAELSAENARLRERVAALEVVAGHVEDAWQDEGVHGEGFVFNLNWLLSVARGGELSPYLKDRAALAGQEQAS